MNNFTRPNSGNWWEVLSWGWGVFYPLSWMFTFLEFWHSLAWHEESKKTNVVSLVFVFTECVLLIKDRSILQEVCQFLIARQRESVSLCSKPQPIIQSQRVIGLMVFPRGNPFLAHFPSCTSLLHPFLSKETVVSFLHMCWSCFIHISYELLF